MSHHVTDDEGDPVARQVDHVVPVAADLGDVAAGQIAVGDLHVRAGRQRTRKQRALEGEGDVLYSAVEARVVEAECGAGGELTGEAEVLVGEGGPGGGASEDGDALDRAPGDERGDDHADQTAVSQQLGARLVNDGPGHELVVHQDGDGTARLQHPVDGRAGRVGDGLQPAHEFGGGRGQDGAGGDPAGDQRKLRVEHLGFVHPLHDFDDGGIREVGHGGRDQFPGGDIHVQGGSDGGRGTVQQSQPLTAAWLPP